MSVWLNGVEYMNNSKKDDIQLEKYIIVQKQRIFIDICEYGCGSSCAYCYVPTKSKSQRLLSFDQIQHICHFIGTNYNCHKRIISLCPNTEPLKTEESINLILYIVRFFISLGSYIQISTKEKIPKYFLKAVDSISQGRVYINISIPYLINSEILEPNAAPVNERFDNFIEIQKYRNLKACLYIKPFDSQSPDIQTQYINMINSYNIQTVCVGVKFEKTTPLPCQSLYNKPQAKKLFEQQYLEINNFIMKIRGSTSARVYGSSICCIHNDFLEKCTLSLFEYDNLVCRDCALWNQ